jgi:hypothetical protein
MFNKIITLSSTIALSSLLMACGGSSDSSTEEEKLPEYVAPVLSLKGANVDYLAIQQGDGEWQKLTLTNQTITPDLPATEINIAIRCDDALEIKQLTLTQDKSYTFDHCIETTDLPKVTVEVASSGYTLLNTMITKSWGEDNAGSSSVEIILNELSDDHTLIAYAQRQSDDKVFVIKQTGLTLIDGQVLSIDFSTGLEASIIDVTVETGLGYYAEFIAQVGNYDNLDISPYQISGDTAVQLPASVITEGYISEEWSFGQDSGLDRVVATVGASPSGLNGEIPEEYTQASFDISQDKKSLIFEEKTQAGLGLKSDFIEFDLNMVSLLYNIESERVMYNQDGKVNFQLLDISTLPDYTFDLPADTIDSISITTYSISDDWPAVGSAKLMLNTAQQY